MEDLKLIKEINSFKNLWKGGFRTGYSIKRNQKGIEKYLQKNMTGKYCLEIGCGGGQWSKFIYNLNVFDKIYCIDVLSAEHNKFWEYVGNDKKDKIEYFHIKDFSLKCIPLDCLDYVFSYDVFCHISCSGQIKYLENLYEKCKINCKLFIMYADPKKYLFNEPEHLDHVLYYIPNKGKNCNTKEELIDSCLSDKDGIPSEGRWYWVGIENFTNLCIKYNYKILDKDLNIHKTNPITLFTKY
jgi:SAM-dependent methyltransferase